MRRRRLAPWLCVALLLAAGLLARCTFDLDVCQVDDDCGGSLRCSDGLCVAPSRVDVIDNIGASTTWTADRTWVLTDVIMVQPSVTLTIEPGTRVLGMPGAALVVRAGGVLHAEGTREAPIVFTSAEPAGHRAAGDWAGVAILGQAPVNRVNATLRIKPGLAEAPFGGLDPEWSCGTLRYVRIEFAGGMSGGEKYLNSLSLAGCGRGTVVDHVQLHFGGDDGLEIFGGTVDVRHVVVTRAWDAAFDIDCGWTGTAQFVAVQLDAGGQNGIESDNLKEDATALPHTDFQIYNYTLVGSPASAAQPGIVYQYGAGGRYSHGIVMSFGLDAVDVVGPEAGARAVAGECEVRDTLFFENGGATPHDFPVAGTPGEDDGSGDDDGGFAEDQYYTDPARGNVFGQDPGLAAPHDLAAPSWVPSGDAVLGVDPPPAPFDPTGNYRGAFAPGQIPWTDGWTAYPES
jgi:hypothetical protein